MTHSASDASVPSYWKAPTATDPVRATVSVPGSKSLTNRYLLLAALASGPSKIRGALQSRDSALMISALETLGARISSKDGLIEVQPISGVTGASQSGGVTSARVAGADPEIDPTLEVDCGLAGTVMRFVPPLAGLVQAVVNFDGDPQARVRPMGPTLDALRELGIEVAADSGHLPFAIHGTGTVAGGHLMIDASASSQFVSALLLSAFRWEQGLHLEHVGKPIPSPEHVAMTVAVLQGLGVEVDDSVPNHWIVSPGQISGFDVQIEPDLSNAGPFLAAALVTGGTVRIPHWPVNTTQIGDSWPRILTEMGAEVVVDDGGLQITGNGRIRGGHFADTGELAPTVAALCALADSPSTLTGIAHLRGHETNRLQALSKEINALGGNVKETADGLVITPAPLHGGKFSTYHDPRMATAGAIIGLAVPGVEVENIGTTGKTLPNFDHMWRNMLSPSTMLAEQS